MKIAKELASIQGICIDEYNSDLFYFYTSDNILYHYNIATNHYKALTQITEMNKADAKESDAVIEVNCYHGYIAIVQKFGLKAAVYDMKEDKTFLFLRTDYHANLSVFSHAFLQIGDNPIFLHQSKWNRLDAFDLTTKQKLTERIVRYGEAQDGSEKINYFDYFHSSILKSPDNKYFITNGWHWGPQDTLYVFAVDSFMEKFELSNCRVTNLFTNGYNWDRPCAFISNDIFVSVQDKDNESKDEPYIQLLFYQIKNGAKLLAPYKKINVELFKELNDEGEISGKLYFLKTHNSLIALEKNRLRMLDLEMQQITERDLLYAFEYQFSEEHQRLYRYDSVNQEIKIEKLI